MGDQQRGSLVGHQGVLEHLLGGDVEVIGGLIQNQQIAGGEQHQGQGQTGFLSAAELPDFLEHRVVAEAETAQQRTNLGLGPVGNRFVHRVDHGLGQIQGFGLVLFEVPRNHVVLPKPGTAFIRGLNPHHQAQQGGLARTIGAHEGNAVTPLHLQFSPQEQDFVSIAVGDVVDQGNLGSGARGRRELKTRPGHGFDRCLHPFHFVQLLLTAFGLGAAGGTGAEAIDVGLLRGDLFLLPFEGRLCGLPLQLFLLQVGGVVAEVAAGHPPFGGNDLIADPVEEGAVVADHHKGCALLQQVVLQPLDGFDIQMVGGFVEQQKIRFLQQDFSQGNPHLPAPGIVLHLQLSALRGEADRGQELVDAGIEFVAMQCFETALQLSQLLDQLVQMIGILRCPFGAHRLFHLLLLVHDLGRFAEGLKQFLAHGALQVHVEFLLEIGDAGLPLPNHLAAGGLFVSGDQTHLGGLAGAVHPHQADPVSGFHLPGHGPEHFPRGVDLADVFESQHRRKA